ncbi:MAG TPA: hypothetical protein VMW10_03220 [Alphaproteobacteria bacterium]|nr:hypothetical protein [Alphaproteobacteria bacterium]
MANIEKDIVNKRKKISQRIKVVRSLAGYSERKTFCLRFGFPLATLEAWERGKNPLTLKGATRLVDILREVGIYCSEEWLREGKGISPRPFEEISTELKVDPSDSVIALEKNLKAAREVSAFITLNEGAVVTIIKDDAMLPFYEEGDYVGGIKHIGPSIKEAINKKCIVELSSGEILVRQLYPGIDPGTFSISAINLNTKKVRLTEHMVKIVSAAPILWHRSFT